MPDPLHPDRWPPEIADMAGGYAGRLNVYRMIAHHPALLRAMDTLREHVVNRTALGAERSEVAILRGAHRLGSSYEWDQHILRARARGLSDARIASIRGPLEEMGDEDRLIVRAVDELFDDRMLSADTLAALDPVLGAEGILDLIATVGYYSVLGYTLKSFAVPQDEDIAAALASRPLGDAEG
ncbi:carboxymuconolactone decarboxylase family protein [Jannaschia seohaensis]|uniref:Alkylhydroperoxidase family enzyme n=1 Tax=Jannaschia seohaensis TaxID=475081 RepID=A0A2Y9AG64_9RHOB|nr:carboxymuconolactone decarboxylase family protein [Jannaschia seohaensis]PWJ21139.1 alkylhydroperoxidase family enzyme [Jannaschia seohaensis]SSA41549.1 Alkylhydroperoxidase family enzyme, contains CxxC motif [Jannaschia seohaensis]